MHVRHVIRMLIVSMALTMLVAGCGSGALSKSDYVDKNNAIQKELASSISKLNTVDPNNKATAAATLLDIQKQLDATVAKLGKLTPPADWKDEHSDILKALKGSSAEIGGMATAVKRGDAKSYEASRSKLVTYNTNFSMAVNSINSSR